RPVTHAISTLSLHDALPIFNTIELSGTAPRGIGKRLHVTVKHADRFNVRYTALDFIHVDQVGETLKITIDHPKGYETDIRQTPRSEEHTSELESRENLVCRL